jgi:hypothetical protein
LKDLDRPARLYQLLASDLPSDFPPPRTGTEGTAFAGRENELAKAAQSAVVKPRRRRRTLLLAVLAAVIAAAVAIPMLALGSEDGGDAVVVSPNSVAVVDPGSTRGLDSVPVGTAPSRVAVGEGRCGS